MQALDPRRLLLSGCDESHSFIAADQRMHPAAVSQHQRMAAGRMLEKKWMPSSSSSRETKWKSLSWYCTQ